MCDRLTVATGVLALLVATSQVAPGQAQGQAAPQGPAAGTQGGGTGAPQGRGAGPPQGRGAGGGRGDAGPFTPEPGAKDLKSILFNWTWHMGMLRSGAESELVKTLDYHAAGGTIQVDGQPCPVTKYRGQANYQIPGWRPQPECVR